MKTYNHLYSDKNGFIKFINDNKITDSKKNLIRIHTSCSTKQQALSVACEVRDVMPESPITGFSAYSVIYNSQILDSACLVSVSVFEDTDVSVSHFSFDNRSPEALAHDIFADLCDDDTKVLLIFASDMFGYGHQLVDRLNMLTDSVRIIGGIASLPDAIKESPYVFTDEGIFDKSLLVAALSSGRLTVYNNVMIGHEPIGGVHTITKTDDTQLLEIDNIPAAQWFKELLGQNENAGGNSEMESLIVKFPLVLENHGGASRCVKYDSGTDVISSYNNKLDSPLNFRIGYLSPHTSAIQCRRICNETAERPIESLFGYSCFLKREAMHKCSGWELTPFCNTDLSGAFTSGEFGNVDGRNEYFNASCSILGLAENDSRIKIDFSAFAKMHEIDDDRQELYNYVLKKQSEFMYLKNEELRQQMIKQSKLVRNKLFVYGTTGLENMTKFIYDNEYGMYDKVCLVSIEKGQLFKGHFGQVLYDKILNTNIDNMKKMFNNSMVHYYQYDQHAFLIAGKKEYSTASFLSNMENLYMEYGNFNIEDLDLPCINIFAIVLEQDKLLEKAGVALSYASQHSKRFFVYKGDNVIDKKIDTSIFWVNIINDAIHNDRVIPYFQPIYNNKTGKFQKFESLMRIKYKDGTIYYPGQFLDIAKEYRLYHQLSSKMIKKVFDLFDDRDDMVSINLTAFDISTEEMKASIFDRLKTLKHPENFIFEIVESEEFRDFDELMDFIGVVRSFGAKIAIDDFGAGYSNLIELAKISPDYLKIDGEITKNFITDNRYKAIMMTIKYLATELDIDVIAEFVENGEIQDKIKDLGITYSQGYHFSRPLPYEKIDDFCKNFG